MANNNEVRFIITGDLHWTGRNPKARIDDYREALTYKIEELYHLVYKYEAGGIIIPGDIFDSPGVSISVLTNLMQILANSPVKIYTIAGNHDLYSGNPKTESRTPYGVLCRSGLIHDVNDQQQIFSTQESSLRLTGKSYDAEITDKNINYYLSGDKYNNPVTRDRIRAHITHGMLLERSTGYELKHTLLREVAERHEAPDILINGHEHSGFGIKKINNTLFINPGSIGRIKATEENLNRQPQVALLTIPADSEPHAELIQLESAASGHKVLSRKHIEEQKRKQEMTKEFLGLLAEEGNSNYMDLEDIMSNIADKESLPEDVVEEALARVEKEREAMDHEQRAG